MSKGKYQSKKQISGILIAVLIVILAVIVGLSVFLLKSCNAEKTQTPGQTNSVQDKPTEPKPTETEPTEPKPTEPKPTEPEPTEPEPTEPEPTEPEPTEPEPTEPEPTEPTEVQNSKGKEIAALAESLIGKPEKSEEYPNGFDVGSFVRYCFSQCGFTDVPWSYNMLKNYGTEVTDYQPGDLVVFYITPADGEPYDYFGIVVEGDQFVAVSSGKKMVVKRSLSGFAGDVVAYRRVAEAQH